jgi:hypothetical protein
MVSHGAFGGDVTVLWPAEMLPPHYEVQFLVELHEFVWYLLKTPGVPLQDARVVIS